MQFRTIVNIQQQTVQIEPLEKLLFVGSCFAGCIGRRFQEELFEATVNPFGVMYNPASILHTVQRWTESQAGQRTDGQEDPITAMPRVVFLTLGTNHVYRLRETGEIVDNCEKRPQQLFQEEELSIEECVSYLAQTVEAIRKYRQDVQVMVTVSPIRYAKYGFHGSQLSKATLLLAAHELTRRYPCVGYFPAYEIVLDELRDYRFYNPDMLHPSLQTVEYIWERLVESCFSPRAKQFLAEWQPIKLALAHRPINPDSAAYQDFLADAQLKKKNLLQSYSPFRK